MDATEAEQLQTKLGDHVQLTFHQGDISNPADVDRILTSLTSNGTRLGGIVHAAGVLADGPISSMTWDQIDKVFQAKVYGTWVLQEASSRCNDLRFFVGYSSIASVLGPSGQANYAAGNAFIDTLMTWRTAQGKPGLAVGWGPWAEVGMAAKLTAQMINGIEGQGFRFVKPRVGARALWTVLGQPIGQVMIGEVDWDRFVAQRLSGNALYREVTRGTSVNGRKVDLEALRALSRADRRDAINEMIRARTATLLRYPNVEDISPHARLTDLGMDSLTAVEMKNTLESTFRTALPTSVVFDYPSIIALAEFIDTQLCPPERASDDDADRLRVVADEELDAELAALRKC